MKIRAVIFDSDGTLVDSEVPGMDILYEMACTNGLVLTREQAHQQFRGQRMADIVAWIAARSVSYTHLDVYKRQECTYYSPSVSRCG